MHQAKSGHWPRHCSGGGMCGNGKVSQFPRRGGFCPQWGPVPGQGLGRAKNFSNAEHPSFLKKYAMEVIRDSASTSEMLKALAQKHKKSPLCLQNLDLFQKRLKIDERRGLRGFWMGFLFSELPRGKVLNRILFRRSTSSCETHYPEIVFSLGSSLCTGKSIARGRCLPRAPPPWGSSSRSTSPSPMYVMPHASPWGVVGGGCVQCFPMNNCCL